MKRYNISFLSILAILIFVVSISGCTNSSNSTSSQNGNKTFTNNLISFQYPDNLTVTDVSGLNSVNIITGNSMGVNEGIIIQVMNQSEYNDAVTGAKEDTSFKGQYKSSGNISYSKYSQVTPFNGTSYNVIEYLFAKNGKFYDMFGSDKDSSLMESLIDSIK